MSKTYPEGRDQFLTGQINLLTDTIKVILIDESAYTYSDAHDFLDDIPVGARIATATLTGITVTAGVVDAANLTFTSVSGAESEALVIYKDTGVAATSPLIAYIDTGGGLPVTPDGANINVSWDDGTNKIFKWGS